MNNIPTFEWLKPTRDCTTNQQLIVGGLSETVTQEQLLALCSIPLESHDRCNLKVLKGVSVGEGRVVKLRTHTRPRLRLDLAF